MAEKEITIKINTDADTSQIQDLKTAIEELQTSSENANNSLSNIGADIDPTTIDEVSTSTDDLSTNAENASNSTTDLGDTVNSLDSSSIGNLSDEMSNYRDNTEDANDSTTNLMDGLASAGLAAGLSGTFMGIANSAGAYGDSMMRATNAAQGAGISADQLKNSMNMLSEATGRSGSQLRESFILATARGITNLDSFNQMMIGAGAQATQFGVDIDTMANKFSNMAMRSNLSARQLAGTGITMEELASVMGVSVDEVSDKWKTLDINTRASILGMAASMNEGKGANEDFKNSWAGLNAQLDIAKGKLLRVIGDAILPTLIPAIEVATHILDGLASGFQALPTPIKGVLGGIATFAIGFTSVGLALNSVFKLVKFAVGPFKLLAQSSRIAAAAQWLLNIAMSANPIMLVVIAIVALIAILAYLYFNNEQVRESINNLGQSLLGLGQWIYNGVIGALETVKNALIGFIQYIIGFGVNLLVNIGLTITNIINRIIGFLVWWYTLPSKIAITFINIIARALGFGHNFVQRITSAGSRAVNNFLSYIRQLPGKLAGELNNMLSLVGRWASTLPQKFWEAGVNAVKNFLNALGIHSPGTMQRMLLWEVSEMGNQVPVKASKLLTNINRLGKDIVDEFGNPRLDYSINDKLGNVSLTGVYDNNAYGGFGNQTINLNLEIGSVDNEKRVQEIVDVIRKELSWDNKTAGRTV